jgi:hypothetical protein
MIPQHNKPASIFILIPIYLPAFKAGGPLKSIANMVDHLGSEFDFHIIASDRDLGDKAAFPGVVPNTWIHVAKAKVLYVRPALRGLLAISRILSVSDYSLLYLNSVFSRLFSMLPLLILTFHLVRRVPVIVAPRGEFSPGALMIKPKRKKLYLSILRLLRLDYGIIWHASSEFERLDIIRHFPNMHKSNWPQTYHCRQFTKLSHWFLSRGISVATRQRLNPDYRQIKNRGTSVSYSFLAYHGRRIWTVQSGFYPV